MSSLTQYAETELELAGLFDEDSAYNGMLGKAALEIVALFAEQRHSGFSAELVTQLVTRLMRYEPLTPLTYGPEEWVEVGEGMCQNRRDSRIFSDNGGKTHWQLGARSADTRASRAAADVPTTE